MLARIEGESQRLRKIVEDLLWLARFDSAPPEPGAEPSTWPRSPRSAPSGSGRRAAPHRDLGHAQPAGPAAWISAPPEWIDRLAGVLIDNACRYAGPDGTVRVSVAAGATGSA